MMKYDTATQTHRHYKVKKTRPTPIPTHHQPEKPPGRFSAVHPDAKAPLGQGGRFAAIEQKAAKYGARNPGAVAAAIGIAKYGKGRMEQMAHAARGK